MRIKYIGHSGFYIEWEDCVWIIDYYKGEIPQISSEKEIFVFASHSHSDHFNPGLFGYFADSGRTDVKWLLSYDIKVNEYFCEKYCISENQKNNIYSLRANMHYDFTAGGKPLSVDTLKSTDCGIAFLFMYEGKTVYHAGDLNLWLWDGEEKAEANSMRALFKKEMYSLSDIINARNINRQNLIVQQPNGEKPNGKKIDIAFIPLDPRLDDNFALAFDYMMRNFDIDYAVPMHFWNDSGVISRLKDTDISFPYRDRIVDTPELDINL